MYIEMSYPVALADAIKCISTFNCESEKTTKSRNPRMVDDNVLEDDEDIYLLPQVEKGCIIPYLIPKDRLDESDWKEHLSRKCWCNTQMLGTFCRLQEAWLKKDTRNNATMIKEEFVSFATAKLLKKAGFPQDIKQTMFYNVQGTTWHMGDHHWINGYAKPTQAMALRWLREAKDIAIGIEWTQYGGWEYTLAVDSTTDVRYVYSIDYTTYEAAAEAGIQAACKYLIEKRKNHGSDR